MVIRVRASTKQLGKCVHCFLVGSLTYNIQRCIPEPVFIARGQFAVVRFVDGGQSNGPNLRRVPLSNTARRCK